MKFKVFKVTTEKLPLLAYQLEVKDVNDAVDYVLKTVHHQVSQAGTDTRADSDGVHLTKWLCLDEKDTYWFIPGGRFKKQPTPIAVGGGK